MVSHNDLLIFFLIIGTVLQSDHSIDVFKCKGNCPGPMTYSCNDVRVISVFKFCFLVAALTKSIMLFEDEFLRHSTCDNDS